MKITTIKKQFSFMLLMFATLVAFAGAPSWSVNQASYSNVMTITGIATISGTELTSSNDMVAAFVGTECRGVTNLLPSATLGHSFAYLMILSNTQGETVHFKIYRGSVDSIYDVHDTYIFTTNEILGNQDSPYVFSNLSVNATAIQSLTIGIAGETSVIDSAKHTVTITVPLGTDITTVTPTVTSSLGSQALISGQSVTDSTIVDLTKAATISIIAQNGTISSWTVTVVYKTVPLTFIVENGTSLIAGATVLVSGYTTIITDSTGKATFAIKPQSVITYTIKASGEKDTTATLKVDSQAVTQTINYYITPKSYSVSFVINDGTKPIDSASITVDSYGTLVTNALGKVTLNGVLANQSTSYIVKASGYNDSIGTLKVTSKDTTVTIQMKALTYSVSFVVKNSTSVLTGAEVALIGYGSATTNDLGMVTFTNIKPQANISFEIKADGYIDSIAAISVSNVDIVETVIMKTIPTFIQVQTNSAINVYPNPFSNYLSVSAPNSSRIAVIDISGKIVLEKVSHDNYELNTSSLPNGIYFITIFNNDGKSFTKTVSKQ